MEISRYDGEGKPVLAHLVVEEELSMGEIDGFLSLGDAVELTINAGVVAATKSHHDIDTQSGAATDDLDTINGGSEGDLLIIRPENTARTVVVKDGTGNLRLAGDFSMDSISDMMLLIKNFAGDWVEISRSNNA